MLRKILFFETYGDNWLFVTDADDKFISKVVKTIRQDIENGIGTDMEKIFVENGYFYKEILNTQTEMLDMTYTTTNEIIRCIGYSKSFEI